MGVSLTINVPLHLFPYPTHLFGLSIEVLPSQYQVLFYSFLPARLRSLSKSHDTNFLKAPVAAPVKLYPEGYSSLTYKSSEGHQKLSVEYDSANFTWMAEVAVHRRMTSPPLLVCLLFTVPQNSMGLSKSTGMD